MKPNKILTPAAASSAFSILCGSMGNETVPFIHNNTLAIVDFQYPLRIDGE